MKNIKSSVARYKRKKQDLAKTESVLKLLDKLMADYPKFKSDIRNAIKNIRKEYRKNKKELFALLEGKNK